ncbi:MAG TPA: vWA domain-containing protein [Gaiellaceae bacterium]|jgi:hypothetical protein
MVLFALALTVLFGMTGLVVDVGYGYLAQRKLQASADAAALAGAQQLPSTDAAKATAHTYGATSGGANTNGLTGVTEDVNTRCLASLPGCTTGNAVVVDETATVATQFARVLGIGSFTVHVRSTACSPCGAKPLDIMLVLDRTGSMCEDHNGNPDPSCTDLVNARNGMLTFLRLLDPQNDHVGLAVLPPATSVSARCQTPGTANYNSTSSPYVVVPLSSDYATGVGQLKTSSTLVSTINCVQAAGSTAYAVALEKAQAELVAHGRPGVKKLILFFSDGAANTGPTYFQKSSPYRQQPCHQGVSSASLIKGAGTTIYSIGYDLNADGGGAQVCRAQSSSGPLESPSITAEGALQAIASDPSDFYNQPSPGQLNTLFGQVAADILHGTSKLVDNDTP